MTGVRVVLGTIPSDSHTWNLVHLRMVLAEADHEVVNLGCCTPIDVTVAACREHQPDLLVISSVNGHGSMDGADLAHALGDDVPRAIIGGKLGIGGPIPLVARDRLLAAGFHAVYDGAPATALLDDITIHIRPRVVAS
jgi:methylmalonyl-CoA mutase cobalamin-binding subunit